MRAILRSLFLASIFTFSCSVSENDEKPTNAFLAKEAKSKFIEAIKLENSNGDLWKVISLYDEALSIYQETDSTGLNYYKYSASRNKAKMLKLVGSYNLAAKSAQDALVYLDQSTYIPKKTTKEAERISTLDFLSDYLRLSNRYEESNKLLLSLLDESEIVKNMHSGMNSRIAVNFMELGDLDQALAHINSALKPQDIEPLKKAFYLNNRSSISYQLGNKQQAYQDIGEAIGLLSALNERKYESRFRMYLGKYQMLDGDYLKADESFAQSEYLNPALTNEPQLFELYRYRARTAAALGDHTRANDYDNKYDLLTTQNEDKVKAYSLSEEYAMYKTKLAEREMQDFEELWFQKLKLHQFVIIGVSILLLVIGVFAVRQQYNAYRLRVEASKIFDKYQD